MSTETPKNPTTPKPQTPAAPSTTPQPSPPTTFIPTTLPPADIAAAVRASARRGSLPGYNEPTQPTQLFTITDFGSPFESQLTITHTTSPTPGLNLTTAIKPLIPIAIAAVLILTVYPGVYLTDMFIREFFPGTLAATWVWWWHIGLSAPFLPFAFRSAWRKSQTTGQAAAEKHAQSIQQLLRSLEAKQHKQDNIA